MASGEQLKDRGQQLVLSVEDIQWRERALNTIMVLASGDAPFTSEDVRAIAGDPERPNSFGAIMSYAARKGLIRKVGYRKAERPSLHASELALWTGQ